VQDTPSTILVVKWKNVAMGRLENDKVFWYDASSWRATRYSGMMLQVEKQISAQVRALCACWIVVLAIPRPKKFTGLYCQLYVTFVEK
jgi:hypothetical protein